VFVAGWSAVRYGMDAYARQMAQQALNAATAAQQAAGTASSQAVGRLSGCRLGSARLGLAVAVGGQVDVPIVWSTPIPVAEYSVEPVAGYGLIGTAMLSVKSKTATGCVVTVKASGVAVAAGAVVLAHATF
jgi:hypothetical protein